MTKLTVKLLATASITAVIGTTALAESSSKIVPDEVVAAQRAKLAETTKDAGFGPQSPRDIDKLDGLNDRSFQSSPPYTEMNLCNIHFHKNAEHRGGDFTKFAGNGDGKGYGTGYVYAGELTPAELAPIDMTIGEGSYGSIVPGDTIEVHYVFSSAKVEPGPTLGACLSEAIMNPQLRVETQVFVLVNDDSAHDFVELTKHDVVNGYHQAINIPSDTGFPVAYDGSTTGPGYNEKGSPLQVSWSVRPRVAKVNIKTLAAWFKINVFDETAAHGVRNLVTNPALLSKISN